MIATAPSLRGASSWRRFPAALAAAWRLGPVKLGFFGALAIEIGSYTPAYLPRSSPLWGPLQAVHLDGPVVKAVGTAVVLLGIGLLVDGWFRLRSAGLETVQPWAVLVFWSLPFLFGPPIFSHDAYSYAAQGWMVHNGLNPYDGGPGLLPGAFADQVAWVWRYTPAPYGPLALQLSHALVDLSGFDATVAPILMRLPALAGVGFIVALVPRLARHCGVERNQAVWFASLNPLLVIDYVGGAHNDSLMMGLVVAALWTASKRRSWARAQVRAQLRRRSRPSGRRRLAGRFGGRAGGLAELAGPRPRPGSLALRAGAQAAGFLNLLLAAALVGTAAAIKQPAFLAAVVLPFMAAPPRWGGLRAGAKVFAGALLSLALAAAVFAALTAATGLGYGWLGALGVPGSVTTVSPSSLAGELIQQLLDPGNRNYITAAQSVGTAVAFALALLAFAVIGRRQPLRALSLSYLAIAFLGPALHSWYVLWGGLLLPLTQGRRDLRRVAVPVTVLLLSYAAINLAWRNGALALGLAAAAVLVWTAVQHELSHRRAARLASPPPAA
ncbi:MAG: polyprenol phosphomannose-dependent alpha 1,6 mannosyltransferase MptB [Propionibacteriaceae bacterium]|jgi:alpha-1,6-mannosyltransferase|nr:polyprenol phosphomannose-dependent alpha 1,6 mannosyltransferase MptB [Propionibacteriaceae bacterium]